MLFRSLIIESNKYFSDFYEKKLSLIINEINKLSKLDYNEVITIDLNDPIFKGKGYLIQSMKINQKLPLTYNCKTEVIGNYINPYYVEIQNKPLLTLISEYATRKFNEMIQTQSIINKLVDSKKSFQKELTYISSKMCCDYQ